MAKALAWIHLYPDDLLAVVQHNGEPPEVTGARVRLWCHAMRETPAGTLPKDDDQLARWAGMTIERWTELKGFVVGGWRSGTPGRRFGDRWIIERLRKQIEEREAVCEARARAARSRWRAERLKRREKLLRFSSEKVAKKSPVRRGRVARDYRRPGATNAEDPC